MSFEKPSISNNNKPENPDRRMFMRGAAAAGVSMMGTEAFAQESGAENLTEITEELKDWIEDNLIPSLADDHKLDERLQDIIDGNTRETWIASDIRKAVDLVDLAVRVEGVSPEAELIKDDVIEDRDGSVTASWLELKGRIEESLAGLEG